MELQLIEGDCLRQHLRSGSRPEFLFEMRHTLPKRQIEKELDEADQIAAPATPVTVEHVFLGIDVEGRASLLV